MSDQACFLADGDEWWTESQVAAFSKFSRPTLRSWRCRQQNGPPFHKLEVPGSKRHFIRYKKSEVTAWLSQMRKVTPAYMLLGEPAKPTQPRPWETQRT